MHLLTEAPAPAKDAEEDPADPDRIGRTARATATRPAPTPAGATTPKRVATAATTSPDNAAARKPVPLRAQPALAAARSPLAPSPGELGLRRILTVVDVLLGFTEESELLTHLLPALLRAVPADNVLWVSSDRERTSCLAEPADPAAAELLAALEAHAEADPLIARVRHGAGTAVRRSDVQSDHDFRRLGAFQAVYGELGIRRQLALGLRPSDDRSVLILFNRTAPDFTHHDIAIAESLRPRLARALARFGPPGARREQVSPREADVLDLLCRGLTDRQIATRLGISPRTVDKHLEHAYVKLGVRCRVQAAARWQS